MNATAPTPDVPTPGKKVVKPSYRQLDFAYGCFLCIVFALGFGPFLWLLPLTQGDREGYGMLLGVPIMFGAFIAGGVGLVLAIVHRSEWQLGAMAVASVVFLATWALDEETMMVAAVLYTVVLISFCGGWFFFRRRKMKRAEGAGMES
jgi:hypothetical protein